MAMQIVRGRTHPVLVLLAVSGPGLYLVALSAASLCDGVPIGETPCFDPAAADRYSLARMALAIAMGLGAVLLTVAVPWLLGAVAFRRRHGGRATAHVWSLVANSAALVAVCLVLRNTVGIDRVSFLAAWSVWTTLLLVLAGPSACSPAELRLFGRRFVPGMALGAAVVAVAMTAFHREHFVQCYNGDGTEFDEIAWSLHDHFLPYWEIEPVGQHGTFVANPTVTNSYWTFAMHVLLGRGELATRLPYWIWWLGIFAVSLSLTQPERRNPESECGSPITAGGKPEDQISNPKSEISNPKSEISNPKSEISNPKSEISNFKSEISNLKSEISNLKSQISYFPWLSAIPLALLLLLATLWYTFYVGYDPYMADPANPGVPDALFTLLVLLALDCLRRSDTAGWIAAMVCASLLFYAGGVMFAIMAAAATIWQPVGRRAMVRASLAGAAILTGLVLFYLAWGWCDGSWSAWPFCLQMEWVDKYFAAEPRGRSGLLFAAYFVLGCGGIPALGPLWALARRSPWDRTAATVVLAYLAIILGSGLKNLHYLGPLLPLSVVLWLRSPATIFPAAARRGIPLLAAVSLAVCVWLCWPLARPVFTLNRQLGQWTTFRTGSYEEACQWGRIGDDLYAENQLGWQIGRHTWVGYAQRDVQASRPRPLVVADGVAPSPAYQVVFSSPQGAKLYGRDLDVLQWMARQRPSTGPDRAPWVFRPIAIVPDPRPAR